MSQQSNGATPTIAAFKCDARGRLILGGGSSGHTTTVSRVAVLLMKAGAPPS